MSTTVENPSHGNVFGLIPAVPAADIPAQYQNPVEIIVAHLDIEIDSQKEKITFGVSQTEPKEAPDDIMRYVAELIGSGERSLVDRFETPFDIKVRRPSYVVIVLNKKHNWQFRNDGPAMTTKAAPRGHTTALWHAWAEPTYPPSVRFSDTAPGVDGCRVIFFKCLKRDAVDGEFPGELVNLHIEIIQDKGTANEKRLPLIADPDIKNDGSKPYPP